MEYGILSACSESGTLRDCAILSEYRILSACMEYGIDEFDFGILKAVWSMEYHMAKNWTLPRCVSDDTFKF